MKKIFGLCIVALLMISCKAEQSTSSGDDSLETSVEDAVTTISGLLDDQEGESYATNSQKSYPELIEEIVFPKAYAAGCIRPVFKVCDNGVKSSIFQDCSMYRGNVLASGEIHLEYSQNDCSMNTVGDQVARTYEIELVGPRGGQLQISSADHVNYKEEDIGGGAELTKTTAGFELDILGKQKVFTRNGRERLNRSIRTLSPLEIEGGLRRAVRKVTNGQVEVSHNLAEFTAVYTAENLEWSSACCHPVSGSLSVEYSGSKTGTASVEFGSCGEATLERNGETKNVQFNYCE